MSTVRRRACVACGRALEAVLWRCPTCGVPVVAEATAQPSSTPGAESGPRPSSSSEVQRGTTRRTSRDLLKRDTTRRTGSDGLGGTGASTATAAVDGSSSSVDASEVGRNLASMATLPSGSQGTGGESYESDPGHAIPSDHLKLNLRGCAIGKTDGEAPRPLDYELIELLGEGGMGVVWAARQASLDRVIAVKMIKADTAQNPEIRSKFLTEATVTGDLDHPNIVPIHELGRDDAGALFYAMKRVHGRPWSASMRGKSLAENLEILMRVADAAAFAHSRGIIHRDLKPENVMLGEYGEVLVMDWGLAASVMPGGRAERLAHRTVAGTPSYMAPEMARGEFRKIGVASDVYLLGAILFEVLTGDPPHARKKVAESLLAAKANEIRPPKQLKHGGQGLMDIALTAMATRPEDRFGSVKALQAAIRAYQAHAESLALSERAQALLERANREHDYAGFARAIFGFEEALSLWADNASAKRGVSEARFAYAECAFEKGDLDLAASYLDPQDRAHAELSERVATARAEREEAKHATLRLEAEKTARIEAELRGRVLAAQVESEVKREWQLVFADDFSNPDVLSRWDIHGGQWEWKNGELRVWGGQPQLIILKQPLSGDLRIEFECHQEGPQLNDVSCFLACLPVNERASIPGTGYEFKFGGFDNSAVSLHRPGRRLCYEPRTALKRGERYRVIAEKVGSRLSLSVNGKLIYEVNDDQPLDGADRSCIGLFGWVAECRYKLARVWRLSAPRKADLLETAERHLARGHFTTACDLFTDVLAAADDDASRHERARLGLDRALFMRELWRRLPEVTARLQASWPTAKAVLGNNGLIVDIARVGATSLEPLRGLPIGELHCAGNAIESLSPLRGMRLTILACDRNRIHSLEPLAGMPLSELTCSQNRIASLEPLSSLPLSSLDVSMNRIASLDPLKGKALTRLAMRGNQVASLEPLRGMPLTTLFCEFNRIADLEPLRGAPLTTIDCSGNQVASFEPLRGMRLTMLRANANRVESLDPLDGMPLHHLAIEANRVADLEPLRGMPLAALDFGANQVESLAALSDVAAARVRVGSNLLTSLAPYDREPPPHLEFDGPRLSNAELRRCADLWRGSPLPATRRLADQAEALLLLRAGDGVALRAIAKRCRDRAFLYVPASTTWEQARAQCRRIGARLAVLRDGEEQAAAMASMPAATEAWIGAQREHGDLRWVDGEPMDFANVRDDWQASLDGTIKLVHDRGANWRVSIVPEETLGFLAMWG